MVTGGGDTVIGQVHGNGRGGDTVIGQVHGNGRGGGGHCYRTGPW